MTRHAAQKNVANEHTNALEGAMSTAGRQPPMVVCPRCGPEALSYAGRIEYRLCGECKREMKERSRD